MQFFLQKIVHPSDAMWCIFNKRIYDAESGADDTDDGTGNGDSDDTCIGILLFMLSKLTQY